jgi:hypothetical protein
MIFNEFIISREENYSVYVNSNNNNNNNSRTTILLCVKEKS